MQDYGFDRAEAPDLDPAFQYRVTDEIGLGFFGVAHKLLGEVFFLRRDAGAQPLIAEIEVIFAWPAARSK